MTEPARDEPAYWLAALEARFAAEDREDRRADRARRRAGLPEPPREIRTYDGFADGSVTTRSLRGPA